MKSGKVTLKDISKKTGYSLVSIHRALYNKEGLSDSARNKILDAVKESGYELNYMASSLKRRTINIAFVLANRTNEGDYHDNMYRGGVSAFEEVAGLNINRMDFLFEAQIDGADKEKKILENLLEVPNLDGVVLVLQNTSSELQLAVNKLISKGIPIVLIDDKIDTMNYLCCISPRSDLIGRLGAEFLTNVTMPGTILIINGEKTSKTHQENVQGFVQYLDQFTPEYSYIIIEDPQNEALLINSIKSAINSNQKIVGLYSVRERNTNALCIAASDFPGKKLKVVGSDLCPKNIEHLNNGTMTATIDKNPYQRGYLGIKTLVDYLLMNDKPNGRSLSVPISLVMKSNASSFLGNRNLVSTLITEE